MAKARGIPYAELHQGQSASVERRLTREGLLAFAEQAADADPEHIEPGFGGSELLHNVIAQGMWANSLMATAVAGELPGPGTRLLAEDITYQSPAALGEMVCVTLTVKEKRGDAQVLLEARCEKASGEAVAAGTLLVQAPEDRLELREPQSSDTAGVARRPHFRALLAQAHTLEPAVTAVVHPVDAPSLQGALEAARQGLIRPLLVGPEAKIRAAAEAAGEDLGDYELIDTAHSHAAAERAVALAGEGRVEALMKGALHTSELMGAVVASTALKTERRVSHVWAIDVTTYPRLLLLTDAAINISPDVKVKRDIVQNALDLAAALHIDKPRVAILAATEEVNPDMAATMDAAALCKMAERGQISGGVLDGPLAFDNAISEEAARAKHIDSPVAGRPDILLVPDIEAGNMLGKQLSYLADTETAGIVLGARLPIILTSRADSVFARVVSSALGLLVAQRRREGGGMP